MNIHLKKSNEKNMTIMMLVKILKRIYNIKDLTLLRSYLEIFDD